MWQFKLFILLMSLIISRSNGLVVGLEWKMTEREMLLSKI